MIKEEELNKSCFYYKVFIDRADSKYGSSAPSSHTHIMRDLMIAEQEKIISLAIVTQVEEQLVEIKNHMEAAIDKYIAMPQVPKAVINKLKNYKYQVVFAVSSEELMKIVHAVIDLTLPIPIRMKN